MANWIVRPSRMGIITVATGKPWRNGGLMSGKWRTCISKRTADGMPRPLWTTTRRIRLQRTTVVLPPLWYTTRAGLCRVATNEQSTATNKREIEKKKTISLPQTQVGGQQVLLVTKTYTKAVDFEASSKHTQCVNRTLLDFFGNISNVAWVVVWSSRIFVQCFCIGWENCTI